MVQEFKEKTGPQMLGTLQKNVKNGHINGSEVCNNCGRLSLDCIALMPTLRIDNVLPPAHVNNLLKYACTPNKV